MTADTIVVGAGLAGLCCALELARAGQRVTVLERSREPGGRARTQRRAGFALNLGPHALYRTGATRRVLRRHGVRPEGGGPPPAALGLRAGAPLAPLPFDTWSVLTTALLPAAQRWEVARFLGGLAVTRPGRLRGRSVADWLAPLSEPAREVALAAVRVATYTDAADLLDAGSAVAQLQRALRGVDYLHGGWGRLVEALEVRARDAGVDVRAGVPVRAVDGTRVDTEEGALDARAVVLCVAPEVAVALTDSDALRRATADAVPVRAACLDLALAGETDPARRLGLGLDRPLYVAVHSDVARVAPAGGTLIHAAVYGAEGPEAALRAELEAAVERLHPGWRDRLLHARWLPRLTVCHDLPRAEAGGRRAPYAVEDRPGVWCAGDWVGDEGMLADAAAASAVAVARAILGRARQEAA